MSVSESTENKIPKPLQLTNYKGCMLTHATEAIMPEVESFKATADDLVVSSFPRSGTTWTQAIVSMVLSNGDPKCLSEKDVDDVWPYLEANPPTSIPFVRKANQMTSSRLIKTHLPLDLFPTETLTKKSKIIYVIRNPKDMLVSYYELCRNIVPSCTAGSFEEFVQDFMNDKVLYCPYFNNIAPFWRIRNQPNVLFLTYEYLSRNKLETVKRISKFLLDRELEESVYEKILQATSFSAMASNCKLNFEENLMRNNRKTEEQLQKDGFKFIRSGTIGDWKNRFSLELSAVFDKWIEDGMTANGIQDLVFEYE